MRQPPVRWRLGEGQRRPVETDGVRENRKCVLTRCGGGEDNLRCDNVKEDVC